MPQAARPYCASDTDAAITDAEAASTLYARLGAAEEHEALSNWAAELERRASLPLLTTVILPLLLRLNHAEP